MTTAWYKYPICVPFGNPNYDVQYGGSHDMDIAAPPNYPVTALLPGTVSSVTAPPWGKQVGIKLDTPINGVPYMAYLHLSATNPPLATGTYVNVGDLIGWVGGANNEQQYAGTSNPTGQNFLNPPSQSSQIQIGVALMRGPEYGMAGWETFPPVDWQLDPTPIIQKRLAFETQWTSVVPGVSTTSGIANTAWVDYHAGKVRGPALTHEYHTVTPDGKPIVAQEVASGTFTWDTGPHFYHYA
jgi:Peptidase family M23